MVILIALSSLIFIRTKIKQYLRLVLHIGSMLRLMSLFTRLDSSHRHRRILLMKRLSDRHSCVCSLFHIRLRSINSCNQHRTLRLVLTRPIRLLAAHHRCLQHPRGSHDENLYSRCYSREASCFRSFTVVSNI
jgi:hypothetical protein